MNRSFATERGNNDYMAKDHKHITPVADDGIYALDTASWRVLCPVMDKETCNNCGICLTYCPVSSVVGDENKKYSICYEYCKGCGICAAECPKKAINMIPEGGRK